MDKEVRAFVKNAVVNGMNDTPIEVWLKLANIDPRDFAQAQTEVIMSTLRLVCVNYDTYSLFVGYLNNLRLEMEGQEGQNDGSEGDTRSG